MNGQDEEEKLWSSFNLNDLTFEIDIFNQTYFRNAAHKEISIINLLIYPIRVSASEERGKAE